MVRLAVQDNNLKLASMEIVEEIISYPEFTQEKYKSIRRNVCKKYKLKSIPSNSYLLSLIPNEKRSEYEKYLRTSPIRTASGIAIIGVMTKPHVCPHGTCIFCPGGIRFGTPQSYVKNEPGVLKAIELEYDPCKQVLSRINLLTSSGHRVNKAELIMIGGTFLSLPIDYQRDFIKGCFDGLNGVISSSLGEAHRVAEKSRIRNVGLTIETKPDWCQKEHVDLMLSFGGTRVEIGVQALSDEIYKAVNRGHTLEDVVKAFKYSKDSGFKVVAHMMPGLPGSNPEKDLDDLRTLFEDQDFKPDMLKVYPTLVTESTPLYNMYRIGKYRPYDLDTMIDMMVEMKKFIPKWVRIMRIQREISSREILSGVNKGNLRQLVLEEAGKRSVECKCIRCREIGLKRLKNETNVKKENIKLLRECYEASDGLEIFASYEDVSNNILIGFIRIRIPSSDCHRPEIINKCGLVRELHVYGQLVPVGENFDSGWQHKGFGSKLMKEAERICSEEFEVKKMVVISAVGTREYYRKLGYELEGPYMIKHLK